MQKAKDLSEITKLNMAVSESETKINEIYSEIGYKVYCAYRENPLEEVKEEIGQIRELEEAMEACKLQIQAINAMNSCPRCGAKIKPEMMFCSSCGMKLQSEEQETVEDPVRSMPLVPPVNPATDVRSAKHLVLSRCLVLLRWRLGIPLSWDGF